MNSLLLHTIKRGKIWDFNGGIHPPEMKQQTSHIALKRLPLSDYFIIPLQQHIGLNGDLLVNIGDSVLKGQPLTTYLATSSSTNKNKTLPVHAPTSGVITDIGDYTTAHPSGLQEKCIYLTADGEDKWFTRTPYPDYRQSTAQELIEKIYHSGVAGLGGAGFPTAAKINGGLDRVEILLINAAECEPYITADDRLMQEHAAEIIQGIEILRYILNPELTIIGIEDNKPEAITALKSALIGYPEIILRVIPTKYPSGGARQLTKILTGREVPQGKHSSAIGVLMQNIATVYAIKRAILNDEPLIERVTTLSGNALGHQGNIWVPLGTPVQHVLKHCGYQAESESLIIMGGPLTGFTLPHLNVPIIKITNCILAPSSQEISLNNHQQNCIRCGKCADVCPAGLLPQQLYWYSKGKDHDKARAYHLFDCIECGACAYVCPSNIPLVHYYRQEKAEIREQDKNELLAQQAKTRFEAKQARLEQEKLARQQRHKQAAVTISSQQQDEIQAALVRVKAKQNQSQPTELMIKSMGQPLANNGNISAARQTRKELARQNRLEKASAENPETTVDNQQTTHVISVEDTRKQAVIEAIARAKARKQAMQPVSVDVETTQDKDTVAIPPNPLITEQDPRKIAVAKAIANAKARKQSASQEQQAPVTSFNEVDK